MAESVRRELSVSVPCADPGRRQPSVSQEDSSPQKPNWPAPDLGPELGEINVCCFSQPVYGVSVGQPALTSRGVSSG